MKQQEIMKQVRSSILGVLGCICLILIVSEPADEEKWFTQFFIVKGLGFSIGYVIYRLFSHWDARGLLPEIKDDDL